MGEALGIVAVIVIVATLVAAIIVRMIAQVVKDSGREKKVTECIASLNMLMAHVAMYNANTEHTSEQRDVINGMATAWNQRYSHWRGYQKIPPLSP